MSWHVTVLPGRYADSVRLMGIARSLRERDGIAGCEVAMGTAANLEALAARGVIAEAVLPTWSSRSTPTTPTALRRRSPWANTP